MNKLTHIGLMHLAFKQLIRELRSGELRVLLVALFLTVTISTAIGYFSARLHASMEASAGEFLAADLMLKGSTPSNESQLSLAKELNLEHALTVNFSTVVVKDDIQLVSVKAADSNYPLRGQLRVQDNLNSEEYAVDKGPQQGELWVESRLLYALSLSVGDEVNIGRLPLKITRIITYAPDRSGGFYSLNPFVLMNRGDLATTGAVQKGSREVYRDLWAGKLDNIQRLETALQKTLSPNQTILLPKDGSEQVNSALDRAQTYLNLASLVGILLASVAVALAANQFASNRYDDSALLRSLGLKQSQVLWLYGLELLYVSIIGTLCGALLGWFVQLGLFELLTGIIKTELPSGGIAPAFAGIATGFIVLIGFALPPLASLGRTPPLRVLRQDLFPVPLSSFVVYSIAALAVFFIMWQLSLNFGLTFALLGGAITVTAVLGLLLYISIRLLRRLLLHSSFVWRMALGQVLRYPVRSMGQIVAFGIILMTMALVLMLRGELLENWQSQLPKDAPNYFAMNITSDELPAIKKEIEALSPNVSPFYPMVAGRLTEVKGIPVAELGSTNERAKNSTERDLNLTWSLTLPDDNKVVKGQWWSETMEDIAISIEDELAEGLNVTIGDELTFVIAGEAYKARVDNIRNVSWENIQPNFFVIFHPNSLHDVPVTYLNSFYLPEGMDKELVNVVKAFPTVTFLDLLALITQLNSILQQVTIAVEYILVLVLVAGLVVLIAGLQATLHDRLRQGAILRVLGASRNTLWKGQLIEFVLIGGLAGFLAMLGSEFISLLLYKYVLNLSWQSHLWLITLPFIGALFIALIGIIGTRKVIFVSPLIVLRG